MEAEYCRWSGGGKYEIKQNGRVAWKRGREEKGIDRNRICW
jgi:hypothetical protein